MKKIILNLILILIIILGFGKLYFSKYSVGARGDDSAGYIFNAGRLYNNQPAIYQDSLVKKGLDFFGDRTMIEFLVPTHSNLLNSDGTITTKYPLGISYFMSFLAKIFKTDLAFYYLNPLFAILTLVLVYILSIYLFKNYKYKYLIALLSVLILGFSFRFFDAVIAQPMREIVFMFFLLLGTLFFIAASRKKNLYLLAGTAVSLGIMILIRSTGFIFVPIFAILSCLALAPIKKENLKIFAKILLIFVVIIGIVISPLLWHSWQISKHKNISDVYKSKTVVLPDVDHLKSLNLQNILASRGKFRPDQGGLSYYVRIINSIAPFPFFIFLVFIGFVALWKFGRHSSKIVFWLFLLNIVSYVLLFSAWINPYPRYILPIFPFLIILAAFGLVYLLTNSLPTLFPEKISSLNSRAKIFLIILILISFFGYYYGHYFMLKNYRSNLVMETRAMSKNDLLNLKDLGQKIKGEKTIVVFGNYFKNGLSETFQTHTKVSAIRAPYLNEKMIIPKEKLIAFLSGLAKNYNVYLWFDKSSDERNNELFFENFILEKKYNYEFSFINKDVTIFRVKNK
jgi:hypothetical protein